MMIQRATNVPAPLRGRRRASSGLEGRAVGRSKGRASGASSRRTAQVGPRLTASAPRGSYQAQRLFRQNGGTERQDRLRPLRTPAGPADSKAPTNQVTAHPFDDPGGNRQSVTQGVAVPFRVAGERLAKSLINDLGGALCDTAEDSLVDRTRSLGPGLLARRRRETLNLVGCAHRGAFWLWTLACHIYGIRTLQFRVHV